MSPVIIIILYHTVKFVSLNFNYVSLEIGHFEFSVEKTDRQSWFICGLTMEIKNKNDYWIHIIGVNLNLRYLRVHACWPVDSLTETTGNIYHID